MSNLGLPSLHGDLYSSPGAAPFLNCAVYDGNRFGPPGDASVDSWLREFMLHESGVFIYQLNSIFAKNFVLFLGRSEPDFNVSLPTLPIAHFADTAAILNSTASNIYYGMLWGQIHI